MFRNDEVAKVNRGNMIFPPTPQFLLGLQQLKKYVDWVIKYVDKLIYCVVLGLELLRSNMSVHLEKIQN